MHIKSIFLFVTFFFSCPIFSQNIFIDSNQVALFFNGNFIWSKLSQTTNLSGGISIGGILDLGYQYGSSVVEGENYYDKDTEYEIHSVLASIILTKKKMQLSLDLALAGGKSTTILIFGFSIAKKYQFENSFDLIWNLSTGLAFDLENFPQGQEAAFTASVDFFFSKIIYFGPGIGYSGKEFFYGLNVGFVIPFANTID